MTLSTRVSLQWLPDLAFEETSTLVIASPQGHYVDIRIYKDKLLDKPISNDEYFNDIFQWCLAGKEVPIKNTSKIIFKSVIDSQAISRSILLNKPLIDCIGDDDVGDFSTIENSDDRIETGEMTNPETGKKQDYIEIWRSLDPEEHTPILEVKEPKNPKSSKVHVLEVSTSDFEGKVVRLGNWMQGIIYDKFNKKNPINVIRSFYNNDASEWDHLIEYGDISLFPVEFIGEVGDISYIGDRIVWKCIEN